MDTHDILDHQKTSLVEKKSTKSLNDRQVKKNESTESVCVCQIKKNNQNLIKKKLYTIMMMMMKDGNK